ncbi:MULTISPECIES: carbohydrate ABC transporter permease [unclassified Actinomyces]|uniref:carbohydrate ABC transporter permease n=1 Tax=unclassified Actinomyces TaxID=2609248 RepID=UPI000A65DF71|nr:MULTISPECIES: sugar ABC transporter permease [unclassified Actinomyces]MDU5232070.1 sugar ABC transporter permease [Actinomyces sp.]MDU6756536.1 sugar ABC transporter permease [Actinomyces sp.]MDU7238581.1 sugar ABC transporter permease [Actinomyces sp.]
MAVLKQRVKLERRPTGPTREQRDRRAALAFLTPNAIGFLAFTLIPFAASLVLSFFDWPLIGSPSFAGIGNWSKLLTEDPNFWPVLWNTVYFAVAYVIGNLVVSLGLALWLSSRIHFKGLFRWVFFLPVVSPMVANAVVWRLLLTPNEGLFASISMILFGNPGPNWLGDTNWAMPAVIMMSIWQGFGYNMIIFVAGIGSIPQQVYEAAAIDGANWWQRTFKITLPLLTPSIFFAVIMTIISSLQTFAQPFILTSGGPGNSTTTLVYYLYQRGFQGYEMGYASTIAWSLFAIILVVTFIQYRGQDRWVNYQ